MTITTHMSREIAEIPEAVARLLERGRDDFARAGASLRDKDPAFLVTIARGSSDHAAHFIKYAVELQTGRPVASLGPSIASVYKANMRFSGGAAIAISQSGKSPDIVAMAEAASETGAVTIALTNTIGSPIAKACRHALDIAAGPELAVAATKSYVNSIVAGLAIVAEWTGDAALSRAVTDLPEHMRRAVSLEWDELAFALGGALGDAPEGAESLYMLGRGPALAIAGEAALKFKETSEVHAEAYSAAEVLHGPVALVNSNFPVILFAARDAAEPSVVEVADTLADKGGLVFATSDKVTKARPLPYIATGHPLTDALALIGPFYTFVEGFSRARGFNPDQPAALKKVTETL